MGKPTESPPVRPVNVTVNVKFVGRTMFGSSGVTPGAKDCKSDNSKIAFSEFDAIIPPLLAIGFGKDISPLS